MKSALGTLLFPAWWLWFTLQPVAFGERFLRGAYLEAGIDQAGVPLSVTHAIAVHAWTLIDKLASAGMLSSAYDNDPKIIAYQKHLLFCAYAARAIIFGEISRDQAKMRHPELLEIIETKWPR